MTKAKETVAQAIARTLQRHRVGVIFGQSLPSAVALAAEAIGIRQIAYRQENVGGAMADGSVQHFGPMTDDNLRALLTAAGGEPVDPMNLQKK